MFIGSKKVLECVFKIKHLSNLTPHQLNLRTLKDGCPFQLSLRVNSKGDKLCIISFDNSHNHVTNRELFKHLPQQRKLTSEERSVASKLMEMGVNKKLLQQKMMRETKKVVLLKDLANIEQQAKNAGPKNNLQNMVEKLENKYHCNVKLLSDPSSL